MMNIKKRMLFLLKKVYFIKRWESIITRVKEHYLDSFWFKGCHNFVRVSMALKLVCL